MLQTLFYLKIEKKKYLPDNTQPFYYGSETHTKHYEVEQPSHLLRYRKIYLSAKSSTSPNQSNYA